MRIAVSWAILLFPLFAAAQANLQRTGIDFYGDTVSIQYNTEEMPALCSPLNESCLDKFQGLLENTDLSATKNSLLAYKAAHHPDDWMFYQLIRKAANEIAPKKNNYNYYTLVKWLLLNQCGYDAIVSTCEDKILLYVQSNDLIYEIPTRSYNGQQYVCLNYHDYGEIDFTTHRFTVSDAPVFARQAQPAVFSYKLTRLPAFSPQDYSEKTIRFNYQNEDYKYTIKVNEQLKNIFANYPVADYGLYFDAPLSKGTYNSLIPKLKEDLWGMSTQKGIDYLMRFTRYAFSFQADNKTFGKEKRLSPEQTLLADYSDCEDRAALFYYLVKEIYNVPMIVLVYPQHVTIAVKFDKPIGKPIVYNGNAYSVCEPTPQRKDLPLGSMIKELEKEDYQVAYAYEPQ